jgi:type IV secretory pathway component VirB8
MEPPVLLSRLMTFVFAGALVVVLILILTITRIAPLEKVQIFFLTTQPHDNLEISLQTYSPNDAGIEIYKENFIKEYVKARNEIIPNAGVMQRKWRADYNSQVYAWSAPDIYAQFAETRMVVAMMSDIPGFELRCPVDFRGGIAPRGDNKYAVSFTYSCTDSSGQAISKDYTIVVKLEMQKKIKWEERLRNPLGVKVVEYSVEAGGNDPLDFE